MKLITNTSNYDQFSPCELQGLEIGGWTTRSTKSNELPLIEAMVGLAIPRPNYSVPAVGSWEVLRRNGELLLSSSDFEVEEDYDDEAEQAAAADELAASRLEDLQKEVDNYQFDGDIFVSVASGGGSNAALFILPQGARGDISIHDQHILLPEAVLIALDTGTNLALNGAEFAGTSWFQLTQQSGKPLQWRDFEYAGSVPALESAATAEEAIRIVTLLREIEQAKEEVLHKGNCELREGELAKCVPPANCE